MLEQSSTQGAKGQNTFFILNEEDDRYSTPIMSDQGWKSYGERLVQDENITETFSLPPNNDQPLSFTPVEGMGMPTLGYDLCREDKTYSNNANEDRIKLLVRKYEQQYLSSEENARLEILTERIEKLLPSVTVDDFERLAALATEVKELQDANDLLREELELD